MRKEDISMVSAQIRKLGKTPHVGEVAKIIEPHVREEIDMAKLYEKDLYRRARNFMKREKDEDGISNWYCDGSGKFVNVQTTDSMPALNKVGNQLKQKYISLNSGIDKVNKRKQVLFDQLSMFDGEENA